MYPGHTTVVTCTNLLLSGMYIASGDAHGRLQIWAYNHDKHLPRLGVQVLAGLVRDVCWDHKGVWVDVCRDRRVQSEKSSRVVMWVSGVKCGNL